MWTLQAVCRESKSARRPEKVIERSFAVAKGHARSTHSFGVIYTGANALLKIGQLIVFNSQFRQQIQELVSIAQEVFGDVASKVGETLQSTGQELGEQTQRLGEEAQSMADRKRQEEMVDSLQRKLRAPPTTTEAQQQATGEEVENAQESMHQTSQKIKEQMEQQQEQTSSTMQQRTEQVKQGVQRQMQEARRYAREKLPPEKVDEIVERLKAALAQVQGHPEYQQAIDTIIILLTKWSSRLADVSKTATGVAAETTEQARSETTWAQAELEAKTIMEDWAQGRSMDPLIDYAKKVMLDVKNDSELREYYNQVGLVLPADLKFSLRSNNHHRLFLGRRIPAAPSQGTWLRK